MKKVLLVPLSFLLLAACSKSDDLQNTDTPAGSTLASERGIPYTGEQMFRAIYFLQSAAVGDIPSLQNMKNEVTASIPAASTASYNQVISLLANDVVGYINQKYPAFFTEFKQGLESDNLYRIRNTLDSGINKLLEAGSNSTQFSSIFHNAEILADPDFYQTLSQYDVTTPEGIQAVRNLLLANGGVTGGDVQEICCTVGALVCAVYIAVAVHSYVAVTATVAVAAIAWLKVGVWSWDSVSELDVNQLCAEISYL